MEKNFKQRVADFWEAFEKQEVDIRKMIDGDDTPEVKTEKMSEILNIALQDPYFNFGVNTDGKYELILTPEGNLQKLIRLDYLVKQAPSQLLERWNFFSSKPAMSAVNLGMFGIDLKNEDIEIYYSTDEDKKKVDIEIFSPKLMALDDNQRYAIFFILLDLNIGEVNTMLNIGFIDFVETTPIGKPFVLPNELKETIEKLFSDNEWTLNLSPLELYFAYRLQPEEKDNYAIREDVVIGSTCCIPIINDFMNQKDDIFLDSYQDGVTFGFIFYDNRKIDSSEVVNFRADIEDKINELAMSKSVGQVLGGATGKKNSYLDFVIYDLDAFLEIAKSVFKEYDLEEVSYANFVYGAKVISIK